MLAFLLVTLVQVPSLARAQDEPSGSTASTDAEPDGEPEAAASDARKSTGGRSGDIQEVIQVEGVRAAGLKEVPISVTSFGASDIQNLRIQNVADLSAYTPNLEINTAFAASNPTLFIRGVGLKDYNSNSTGAVSIWQDGIMMNSPAAQLFGLFDVESVAILRGPVVGGRNASAGQIRINTFKPNGEWTSDGSFTYGNYNLLEFDGALGFPILPDFFNDTLSARLAVTTSFRDGYTNNTCANWDPESHGFLESTEDGMRAFYELLEPFDRGPEFKQNQRYIYNNFDAVEQYNAALSQESRINEILVDGEKVGKQASRFRIWQDKACLLDNPGSLITGRGATNNKPEGTFDAQTNIVPLSAFQGLQKTYNNIESYASRFQLLWEPGERWSFLGNFHWAANRGDSFHLQPVSARPVPSNSEELITESPGFWQAAKDNGFSEINLPVAPFEKRVPRGGLAFLKDGTGQGFAGGDIFNGFYGTDGKENLDLMGWSVDGSYEPDWGRIVYIGGMEFAKRDLLDEGGGCPCTDLEAVIDDETWQFSNDLRVLGGGYGFDWTLGLFQLHEDLNSNNLFPSSVKFEIEQDYQQITNAWNLAGDLHYDFLEDGAFRWLYQISFDGGLRYNWEGKEFTLAAKIRKNVTDREFETIPAETVRGFWHGPAGEATLSIAPLENARLYGKFTRGLKAGHFNAALTVQPASVPCQTGETPPCFSDTESEAKQSLSPVAPESVYAVEVGLKSSWWEDRLELNAAFFRYWYEDLQVFDIVNEFGALPTQQLLNADADVLGAELDLTFRPIDGLLLQAGVGWLDTAFREFLVEKQAVEPSGRGGIPGKVATFSYEGNPLIAAPRWSLSGYTEYELPLYRWGSLIPSFNYSFKTRTYLDATKAELISQEPFWLFGARLAYRTPGGAIEVAGWVENFMDKRYKIDSFDLARQFAQISEVWAEPRMFGITVSYAF